MSHQSLHELWKHAQSACNYVHTSLSKRQSQPREPAWTHPACVSVKLLPTHAPLAKRPRCRYRHIPILTQNHSGHGDELRSLSRQQPPGISVLAGARLLRDNLLLDISLIYERREPAQENAPTMCKMDIDTEIAGDNDTNV